MRRWLSQADVDEGIRPGLTSEESAEVKRLRAENRRLREDNGIHRVLRQQGLGIAVRARRAWVTDVYGRTWAGFVYGGFVLDVFAQRIVGWHASSSKKVDLVMAPLQIALWQREREGSPVAPGGLVHRSDAGVGRRHRL